ncbi:uncharacterized protein (TIGR00661 family) [Laceyella sediminis]|uniref:Uncharacterized protein (TIGR00661 family) n=1 Tax=Laceyella sediminis TaxID=573074 RepID=A0ABX5ELM0_9BACL|nr:glycosyltransferase family protein [Laceyella sediminis]PRZ12685.1 uncharacterized protein (TIGR00661 family) [Laceyella sediminis]
MKVLIGVCGIGLGHSTRQWEVAQELLRRGHEIRILTFGKGIEFFRNTPLPWSEVWVPFVGYRKGKLHLPSLIIKNFTSILPGIYRNLGVYQQLIKEDFFPDICISDYEPVTARIAYKFQKPLVLIDQQSKFWRFSFDDIQQFSCIEEKKRLSLFFPQYEKRFITSFYRLPNIEDRDTTVIPPIIRSDLRSSSCRYLKKPNLHLIVYLSEYGGKGIDQSPIQWKKELASVPNVSFTIFDPKLEKTRIEGNLEERPFDRVDFAEMLKIADGVITTAGHTLLSEALYLGIPIYVLPLPTFDQHYCAKFISEHRLGISSYTITREECLMFIEQLDYWKHNIQTCDQILFSSDPTQTIVDYLEEQHEKTCSEC